MDFGFTPEQEMLRASARKLLDVECPPTLVRAMLADATAHAPALWRHLADLGALGILLPAEHGGQGGNLLDLIVVLEEMGRALVPGPFFAAALGGLTVGLAASPAQHALLLPALARGDRLAVLAIGTDHAAGMVGVEAGQAADGISLRGEIGFVMDAHVADMLVVPARREGATILVVVAATHPGVIVTALRTVDMTRRLCSVRLDATVPATAVLAGSDADAVLARVLRHARAGLAVEAVGVATRALELSVAYANERKQFGRPIGSFQAVKHKCVDMMVGIETARSLAYYAAWAVGEDASDADTAVAMAKAYAGDVAKAVTSEAIQVHGGIGFTWEHPIHLYHRRALAIGAAFGGAIDHRETVADALLG
jgi:alkylation response protein AidB-like acyl-CoA dehydrogenase